MSAEGSNTRQWVRQAVDFGALLAFMAAYVVNRFARGLDGQEALIQATWVLVAASAVALIVGYAVERRVAPLPLFAGLMALIFGVLTLVLHNDELLKIKITVQNLILAGVLLGSLPFRKYPFKLLLGSAIKITDEGWRGLTLRYGLFFTAVAITNEVVRHAFDNDAWMTFRGGLWMVSAAFGVWQVFFIMKHMIKDDEPPAPEAPDPGL